MRRYATQHHIRLRPLHASSFEHEHEMCIEIPADDYDTTSVVAHVMMRITPGCPGDRWTPPGPTDIEVIGPVKLSDGRVWDAAYWELLVRWLRLYEVGEEALPYCLDDERDEVDVDRAMRDAGDCYEP